MAEVTEQGARILSPLHRAAELMRRRRALAPVAVLILLCIVVAVMNPRFVDPWNLVRLLNSAAVLVVLTMGATFIILLGSIDLSLEGVLALCAVLVSILVANNLTSLDLGFLAVGAAVVLGATLGTLNGVVHVKLRTPSFMATLGIGFACVGVATAFLQGDTVRISDRVFRNMALGRFLGIPFGVWIAAGAVLVALFIQERTRIGRWLYALGGDEATAQQAGVPVVRTRITTFAIAGAFYGLAGAMGGRPARPGTRARRPGTAVHDDYRGGSGRHRALRGRRLRPSVRGRSADRRGPLERNDPDGGIAVRADGRAGGSSSSLRWRWRSTGRASPS